MNKQEIIDYISKSYRENPTVGWLNPIKNNNSLTDEMSEFIKKTFAQVDEEDYKGRVWYKVYNSKYDSKYGAYMVCFDTEEWRYTTAREFYGRREDYGLN